MSSPLSLSTTSETHLVARVSDLKGFHSEMQSICILASRSLGSMTTSITCPNASVDLIARPLLVCLIGVESIQYSTVHFSFRTSSLLCPALFSHWTT